LAALLLLGAGTGLGADDAPPVRLILMIADGAGFNHFRAASAYRTGRPDGLVWDGFPVRLAVSTFSASGRGYDPGRAAREAGYFPLYPTDSAAAATAMATGFKTRNGALGVDTDKRPLRRVTDAARAAGLAAGLVTTVPLSHATPAAFGVHAQERNRYADLARQLIDNEALSVLMGCGHPGFDANGRPRALVKGYDYVGGAETWAALERGEAGRRDTGSVPAWRLVQDRAGFLALATGVPPARVVGVAPVAKTLQQERAPSRDWNGDGTISFADAAAAPAYGDPATPGMPTLAEMAEAALAVLRPAPRGFFLMIEGGAVDWGGHQNQTGRMIEELLDFHDAVQAVCGWVERHGGWDRTLLLVTADHETGFLQGRAAAGSDATCPPVEARGAGEMPEGVWKSKTHTNQLVPLFARGWNAERFAALTRGRDAAHGAYVDNTDIARVLFETMAGETGTAVP